MKSEKTTNFDIFNILHSLGAIGYDKNNCPLYITDKVSWVDRYGQKQTGKIIYHKSHYGYPATVPHKERTWSQDVDPKKRVVMKIGVRCDHTPDVWSHTVVFSKLSSLERIIQYPGS
jgi:hypothetical protein